MSWTDERIPLSAEDQLQVELEKMNGRDAAITLGVMTFGSLLYSSTKRPEKDHFGDLAFSMLEGVKHVSELELLRFLIKHIEELPAGRNLSREELVRLLSQMAAMVAQKADEKLTQAQRLISLLP